jgi:hypothetical protein
MGQSPHLAEPAKPVDGPDLCAANNRKLRHCADYCYDFSTPPERLGYRSDYCHQEMAKEMIVGSERVLCGKDVHLR